MPTNDYPRDHSFWNPIFILFFILLIVAAYLLISRDPYAMSKIYNLGALDLTILGLATLRIIRLVSYDKILQFFRNLFLDNVDGEYVQPRDGFKRAVVELYECVWCTGMWAALVAITLYVIAPAGFFVVAMLAISALGSVLQNLSRLIAHWTEK